MRQRRPRGLQRRLELDGRVWRSRLEPRPGTSAGRTASQGTEVQSTSDADSVRPGASPGANIASASTR